MRILFVYMFCTNGGVETAIKNRIEMLDFEENSVDLLFYQDCGGKTIYQGLPCRIFIENENDKIVKLIKENGYEVIISIDSARILNILESCNYSGKIGLEVHTTYSSGLKYLHDISTHKLSFINVPSLYQKTLVEKYIDSTNIPINVLPNSIDLKLFYPMKFSLTHNKPILLWVGRLDKHKNWELFLDIAMQIKKQNKDFEFWIIGGMHADENELKKFRNKMCSNNLCNCIKWIPYINYNKMPAVYSYVAQSGGYYITTSANESFGMTVIEAMSCECPVICNDVGALHELIENKKYGILFDMENMTCKEISDKILESFYNKDKIHNSILNAKKMILDNYENSIVSKSFISIIKNNT